MKRHLPPTDIPYPKHPRRLPAVLTVEEVARLIDSARNLFDRTLLMVLYSTGMRNFELRQLQVKDIDSKSAHPHSARQRRAGPLCPAQSQAAGDFAGVLAVDETEDLAVSRYDPQLARG